MTAFAHRLFMFGAAVLAGFAGIAGLSDMAGVEVVSGMAAGSAALTVLANSWRILFPETPA